MLAGPEVQKSGYLPPLASGEDLAQFARTERGAGLDTGTFRSETELTAFRCIHSYLSTRRKLGYAMFNALSAVFTGYPLLVAWEVPE